MQEEEQRGKQKGKDNKYDKVMKENIEAVFLPLTEKYLNFKIVSSELLDVKLQSTIEREVDFLRIVKTDKGEEFILHIEFQSSNERDMIYRVKEYNAIIQRRHIQLQKKKKKHEGKKNLEIRHYVIYLGKARMSMRTRLEGRDLFSHFEVVCLNQLDFNQMLQSQIPEEIILAILSDFKGTDPEKIIRSIVKKLRKYSQDDAALNKFIEQLRVLSDLRKLEEETIKTIKDMPITYNLEESYTYKLGREKGKEEGIEKGIKKGIIAMLVLGNTPRDIAKQMEVSIELVEEIQKELT